MKYGNFFGIDFGTTNTSVVHMVRDEFGEKINILGENGEFPFSSYLCILPDNKFNLGIEVKKNRSELSENNVVISSFKSFLGTNKIFKVNGKELTAKDAVAKFLQGLKVYIKQSYNVDITESYFSFPVDFSAEARKDLKAAAEKAGIKVKGFVNEATAAYLTAMDELKGMSRVMVIDWGGGTLDISILEVEHNRVREILLFGDKIGGDDLDKELAQRVHALFIEKAESPVRCLFSEMPPIQQDKLIAICEAAKIQISEDGEDYPISIRNYGDFGTKTITLTVEYFEEIIKPIILNRVLKTIYTAMERAEVTKASIDSVIVVGGSSNLRPFATAITNFFGEEKIIIPENVQFVSAKGAALMQIICGNFKLDDDIGILLTDDTVFPILKRDIAGVGTKSDNFSFSLTEDSFDAHFIITNGDGSKVYAKENVPTKGFMKERLEVQAEIGHDQIAYINIHSIATSKDLAKTVEINKLTFHYDLSKILDKGGGNSE